MKTLLIFLLSITLYSSAGTKVFICDSPQAVAYHNSKDCRGFLMMSNFPSYKK